MGLQHAVENVFDEAHEVVAALVAVKDVAAQLVDRLALLVHHVVVLEEMLADLEVAPLDLRLGALMALETMRCSMASPSSMPSLPISPGCGRTRRCASGRLRAKGRSATSPGRLGGRTGRGAVVDAPRLVALGAEDVQAAEGEHLLTLFDAGLRVARQRGLISLGLGLRVCLGAGEPLGIAAEDDVGAAGSTLRVRDTWR